MTTALPKKLRVGALTYTISDDRNALLEAGPDLLGHTDHRAARILIDSGQAVCQQRDTLVHELLHILCDTAGLGAEWGEKREEATVRRLTPHLLAALRDNPPLVAYLTGG